MTTKERQEYILKLDKVVRRWRYKSDLYCGGCCFSASVIASLLEKKGIGYKVICWESNWQSDSTNVKSLKDIIMDYSCGHIAIQVILNKKKYIIGGDFYHERITKVRTFSKIKSGELSEYDSLGANNGVWNHYYNRKLNNRFINVLNNAVSK